MNDPIKLLVAGATIALAGVVAGGVVTTWALKTDSTNQSTTPSPQRLQVSGPNSSVLRPTSSVANPPQIRIPGPFAAPSGPGNASGARLQPLTATAFQKVQDVPEVKAAREAFAEAQKKYMTAMQTAMGKTGNGSSAKSTPLTIQVPPARSGTNGTVQVKVK
jgi:hypothetical protein